VNGNCVTPEKCDCNAGWDGNNCTTPVCSSGCDHGNCTAPNNCSCDSGWNGKACDEPICSNCGDHGTCVSPNNCSCDSGWNGTNCDQAVCSNGCVHGNCTGPNTCKCDDGWRGSTCAEFDCGDCVHGNCSAPNGECICDSGYTGDSCEYKKLTPSQKDIIYITVITTSALPWFIVLILAFIKIIWSCCGFVVSHLFTIWTVMIFLQQYMVPLQVNKPFLDASNNMIKTFGAVYLGSPKTSHDIKKVEASFESIMEFGSYLIPKLIAVIGAFILLLLVTFICNRFNVLGVRAVVNIYPKNLCVLLLTITFIPLLFSLFVGGISLSHYSRIAEDLYYTFSAIAVIILLVGVYILLFNNIFKTYAQYAKEGKGLASILKSFRGVPKLGKKDADLAKNQKSKMPLVCLLKDASDSQLSYDQTYNKCCSSSSYFINATQKKRFKMAYKSWLWDYCKHSVNAESSSLAKLRSILTHQFPFIKLVLTVLYTVLSITMWRSKEVFIVLIFYQLVYVMFVLMLMPYRSKTAFAIDMFLSIIFIIVFCLLRLFLTYQEFALLETALLLPAVALVVAMVVIPLFAKYVHAGGAEHTYVPADY